MGWYQRRVHGEADVYEKDDSSHEVPTASDESAITPVNLRNLNQANSISASASSVNQSARCANCIGCLYLDGHCYAESELSRGRCMGWPQNVWCANTSLPPSEDHPNRGLRR